jgi:hypothetical protein
MNFDDEVQSRMLPTTMKNQLAVLQLFTLSIVLFTVATLATAHERDTYKIGNKFYVLTVGSLNEPFVVDNLSGVDLSISQVEGAAGKRAGGTGKGTPVTGLEQTLKVELAAGNKRETLPLDPSDSSPGSYSATFIPTVQTTYSYRIFGTINGNPVDLTFACVPGEVSETAEDSSPVRVSDTITRLDKIGAFACPAARDAAGFPEPAVSSYELRQNADSAAAAAKTAGRRAATALALSVVGFVASLSGLGIAGIAWKRK